MILPLVVKIRIRKNADFLLNIDILISIIRKSGYKMYDNKNRSLGTHWVC